MRVENSFSVPEGQGGQGRGGAGFESERAAQAQVETAGRLRDRGWSGVQG